MCSSLRRRACLRRVPATSPWSWVSKQCRRGNGHRTAVTGCPGRRPKTRARDWTPSERRSGHRRGGTAGGRQRLLRRRRRPRHLRPTNGGSCSKPARPGVPTLGSGSPSSVTSPGTTAGRSARPRETGGARFVIPGLSSYPDGAPAERDRTAPGLTPPWRPGRTGRRPAVRHGSPERPAARPHRPVGPRPRA